MTNANSTAALIDDIVMMAITTNDSSKGISLIEDLLSFFMGNKQLQQSTSLLCEEFNLSKIDMTLPPKELVNFCEKLLDVNIKGMEKNLPVGTELQLMQEPNHSLFQRYRRAMRLHEIVLNTYVKI